MKYCLITLAILCLSICTKAQTNCIGCSCFVNKSLSWSVEYNDSNGQAYLVKGEGLKGKRLSIDKLFSQVKNAYGIKTKIAKIQDSTVYIQILNNDYFKHKSYNEVCDYAEVMVFTLTENPKCKRVYLDFSENENLGEAAFFTRKNSSYNYIICNKK